MKKRSKVSGARARARRPMAKKLTHRDAPKSVPSLKSSPGGDETEVVRLTGELKEALEQQNATSEVLQVISGSPSDLEPVFSTMLEKAVRICGASFGNIYRWDGEALNIVASYNTAAAFAEQRRKEPFRPRPINPVGQMIESKKTVHVHNMAETEAYLSGDPVAVASVKIAGARTGLAVPMLKDNELIGAFTLGRQEIRDFSERQIALVTNFANQAVIAIENARLLNELRQSLEQQTATAEVLKVISSSPSALEPVFKALLENATKLCGASYGNLWLSEGDAFRSGALHGAMPTSYTERWGAGALFKPEPEVPLARVAQTKRPFQYPDIRQSPPYLAGNPLARLAVNDAGIGSVLAVPMLKEGQVVGAIVIFAKEARPFTEKQIKLLENFASQAVIAIENTRLLKELHQRTDDLTEALEQQTATSVVLQIISSSPGDLAPVFSTMLENAVRICDATFGDIYRWVDSGMHLIASYNTPPAFQKDRKRHSPYRPSPEGPFGRMLATKSVVHTNDLSAEDVYVEQRHPGVVAGVELGGIRTVLAVPMLRDNELIGAFILNRQQVNLFTDKQIALVKSFASQAVIAIENARLLRELRERSEDVEKLNKHLEQRVTDQVGEIERMGRLRRFLPPQVADLIVASGSEKQLESHRREITALFCDLRGFTGFTETADAEDVMTLLRDYHAAIGQIVIKYNGTLERYAGDGVMVIFNDPVPVENPALQAVLMALEVRDAIGSLTETWRRWGHDIGFGIGIAHGFATLGTIGFEGRFDYAAIGTVSNVASRLCDEAKPGQILISPRVLTQVETAVKVEPVGEFELKGIRRPLAAYNVISANA